MRQKLKKKSVAASEVIFSIILTRREVRNLKTIDRDSKNGLMTGPFQKIHGFSGWYPELASQVKKKCVDSDVTYFE